jgi:hypothetical protein
MNRTYHILIVIVAVVLGVGAGYLLRGTCSYAPGQTGSNATGTPTCNSQNNGATSTSTTTNTPAGMQHYVHSNYNFYFDYPKSFVFNTSQIHFLDEALVGLGMPRDSYPNTNFSEGLVSVSANLNSTDAQCFTNPETKKPLTNVEIINRVRWYTDVIGGVGAGNIYNTHIYRTMNDGSCFEVAETVHTGNIGNYPEGISPVKEEDVFTQLHSVIQTFGFNQQ